MGSCYINEKKRRLVIKSPFSSRSTVSYGLIVYALNTKKWLIVRRKQSVEFILYIKGSYRLSYLHILLEQITKEELFLIKKCLDENYFEEVYFNVLKLEKKEYNYSFTRFVESKEVATTICNKLKIEKNELKWSWPKGRMLHDFPEKENPFSCACREFSEEVEIELPDPVYVSKRYYSQVIKTISNRSIESRYWLYIIEKEIPITPVVDHEEISDRTWADKNDCRSLLNSNSLLDAIISKITNVEMQLNNKIK